MCVVRDALPMLVNFLMLNAQCLAHGPMHSLPLLVHTAFGDIEKGLLGMYIASQRVCPLSKSVRCDKKNDLYN